MKLYKAAPSVIVAVCMFLSVPVFAEDVKKIQDNSFLLEEAYNQEDGVVQHISLFQYLKKSAICKIGLETVLSPNPIPPLQTS